MRHHKKLIRRYVMIPDPKDFMRVLPTFLDILNDEADRRNPAAIEAFKYFEMALDEIDAEVEAKMKKVNSPNIYPH